MNLHNAEFIKSAVKQSDFIYDGRPQIVFAGKSNVGKSSVINKTLNRKNFARVGNTPGKTVHINYFLIDKKAYFVDLPGYGFAKVSKSERDRWASLIECYFSRYDAISLGVMIVDARHKPTADDITMAVWFKETGAPFIVLANKIDKVKKTQIEGNLEAIKDTLQLPENIVLLPFSAETGAGRNTLISEIEKNI